MTGIVVVSHSAQIAEGVVELARQMAGPDVPIVAAGGIDDPANPIGTDAAKVMGAIAEAGRSGDVLVLMDLGSAVLSAELALSMLDPDLAGRTRLCAAPLVEGAVAAAVAARIGSPIDEVAAEATRGLVPKESQLGAAPPSTPAAGLENGDDWVSAQLAVTAANGLHARPAARFVQTASAFDAEVQATNLTTGAGPARASSLTDVATLGAVQGHTVAIRARGPQAREAIDALVALADRDYDEQPGSASAPPSPAGPMAPPSMPDLAALGQPLFQMSADGAFQGLAAAPGAVVGPARRLRRPPSRPRTPGSPDEEARAFDAALERARSELAFARDAVAHQVGEEHAQMLDAQGAMLEDEALLEPARAAIAGGDRAEVAWQAAVEDVAARFAALDDPYLRARAEDVRDIGRRVAAQFAGGSGGPPTLRGPGILIAKELGAGETATLDLSLVQGIAVATGSPTSHSAILARALGVPAVVNVGEGLMTIGEETPILVDGDAGTVRIHPDAEAVARVRAAQAEREARLAQAATASAGAAVSRDGVTIEVAANVAGPGDVPAAVEAGADGVGLLRSEFLFMGRDTAPTEDEQEAAYRDAAVGLAGRRLVIRTLDAGADKPVPYLARRDEDNPFLGVRGVRLSLAEPELFRTQLRAILRVAADHRVAVMFPMIATVDEVRAAKRALDEARAELVAAGVAAGEPEVGIMIEVPAAALTAAALAPEVAFFSIGTNDLTQYAMAAERGNPDVADLSDPLHPGVLALIGAVCDAARAAGCWVGVCGEAAGDPVATPILLGLGVNELSAAAPRIAEVKAAVRAIDVGEAAVLAGRALVAESAAAVRALSTSFARPGDGERPV